jgi:pimeloyl-ACP methyl ester carboxylesterase
LAVLSTPLTDEESAMTAQLLAPPEATVTRTGHIGRIVIASFATGLVGALTLVLLVFPGAAEHVVTGVTMLAFAFGWAMLAGLSARRTDQPQRWARVPAASMAVVGTALLVAAPGDLVIGAVGWIWPPALLTLAIWMIRSVRRTLRSRTRAWLVQPVCAVLALAAVGGGTETVLESIDHSLQAPAGQTYLVDGHRMYLHCAGAGSPTVLLSNGFGERSPSWSWIETSVARTTRVCVYDRAGQGWSEAAAGPQDGLQLAGDLHAVLAAANVSGPYVLAGHSVGGTYNMIFAARYPSEVAGMVLLDSATPEQFTALPNYPGFYSTYRRVSGLLPVAARLGLGRVAAPTEFAGLPNDARIQEQAFAATARDFRGQRDEWSELPTAFTQAKALSTFGGKPLIVITASEGQDPGWFAAQDKLATLSTNNVHRTIHGATHVALLDDERYAKDSSAAIERVVAAVRAHTELKP